MAYVQTIEGARGVRYRGFYLNADGRYKSAGRYDTHDQAMEVALSAEKYAAQLVRGAIGQLDPVIRATRTIAEYEPVFLRHHRVEGNTKDTYEGTLRKHVLPFLGKVRLAETNRTVARNYFTALVSSGIRFCETIALRPLDLDVDTGVLEVGRSVVKVSRQHHPQGKTFLVREYTKNRGWRAVKLDRDVELVRIYAEKNEIGPSELLFPIELIVPPRAVKEGLSPGEIGDPEVWFPPKGHFDREAKRICAGCGIPAPARTSASSSPTRGPGWAFIA